MEMAEDADFPADPLQGYFVDYRHSAGTPTAFEHYFCGPHDVGGAWCPNCQRPLLRFLALDRRDNRLNLQDNPSPTLSLLFCWTCNIAQEPFFYRALGNGIELLQYGQGGVVTDFPYDNYPLFFTGARAALQAISVEEQVFLKRLNNRFEEEARTGLYGQHRELWGVRHQVGGEPFLTQGLTMLECADCGAEMPFLASVANDCLDIRGLAGNDGVQVLYHLCRQCCVVGVYQMID